MTMGRIAKAVPNAAGCREGLGGAVTGSEKWPEVMLKQGVVAPL